jgi:hypothetical protein
MASESLDNELKTGVLYLEILSQILRRYAIYKMPTVKNWWLIYCNHNYFIILQNARPNNQLYWGQILS